MTFEYKPLPQYRSIRLLQIQPARLWKDPIHCSLIPADLDSDDLGYEAISYAWGDATQRKSIICDGCVVSITRSLFEALQRFRYSRTKRTVWADAICIDQQNTDEKNAQVQLMRIIYQKASQVLIWLGHENDLVVQVVLYTLCQYLCKLDLKDWRGQFPSYRFNDQAVTDFRWESSLSFNPDTGDIGTLGRLCSCAWFGRGWVIQEAALSPNVSVFWGLAQIRFEWIGAVAMEISRTPDRAHLASDFDSITNIDNCGFIGMMQLRHFKKKRLASFFTLLAATGDFAFSDARDRVYGVLALQTDDNDLLDGQPFVNPDYGITSVQCFKNVAERILLEQHDLRVLSVVNHGPDIKGNWPSWVSDWKQGKPTIFGDRSDEQVRLRGPAMVTKEMCGTQECICVQGFTIDVVDQQFDLALSPTGRHINIEQFSRAQNLLRLLKKSYSTEYLAHTFGNLNFGNLNHLTNSIWTQGDLLGNYHSFLQWNPADGDGMAWAYQRNISSPYEGAALFYECYTGNMLARKFFSTKQRMLGIGPEAMCTGDLVVHFLGGSVPFVLRPVNGLFRLVGECYVYDVVEGGVIEEWKKSGQPTEKFSIY